MQRYRAINLHYRFQALEIMYLLASLRYTTKIFRVVNRLSVTLLNHSLWCTPTNIRVATIPQHFLTTQPPVAVHLWGLFMRFQQSLCYGIHHNATIPT